MYAYCDVGVGGVYYGQTLAVGFYGEESRMAERLVLKENAVFMVSQQDGDIGYLNRDGFGLYYQDTRYLSILELQVNGETPVLLTASGEFNFMGNIQSANPLMVLKGESTPDMPEGSVTLLPRTISIRRNRFIEDGLHERLGLFNYNPFPLKLRLTLRVGSDFRDMFDVRGYARQHRGTLHKPVWNDTDNTLRLSYTGLDDIARTTDITFDVTPDAVDLQEPPSAPIDSRPQADLPQGVGSTMAQVVQPAMAVLTFDLILEPATPFAITYHVVPQGLGDPAKLLPTTFDMGARRMRLDYQDWFERCTRIKTDDEVFNRFIERSIYDLRILMEDLPTGLFPVAGIPWYAVPFGRDSLITALQTLAFDPEIAIGTLRFLAQMQGNVVNEWNEEEPGKILHELRNGEMTRLHEMPHVPYYGTVDATPLFILLFVETLRWLNDDAFFDELWPHVEAALMWIDEYGDRTGRGYTEYICHNPRGVKNQGWKDSASSLHMPDGAFPDPPIALCEVQGYVYQAKRGLAAALRHKAERTGDVEWHDKAMALDEQATALKERFNRDFWLPDLNFWAQALDGHGQPVQTISSNPGHCIYSGIVAEDRIAATVARLTDDTMLSGWGIRTISSAEPSYNPMSYHNGSIWPHDNAIIAAGFKRYGYDTEVETVLSQTFSASQRFRYYRLPELYCGFPMDARYFSAPSEYPVSCSPQAWTAGAAILFIQTLLGIEPDAANQHIHLRPALPLWLNEVELKGMRFNGAALDITIARVPYQRDKLEIRVLDNPAGISVAAGGGTISGLGTLMC